MGKELSAEEVNEHGIPHASFIGINNIDCFFRSWVHFKYDDKVLVDQWHRRFGIVRVCFAEIDSCVGCIYLGVIGAAFDRFLCKRLCHTYTA